MNLNPKRPHPISQYLYRIPLMKFKSVSILKLVAAMRLLFRGGSIRNINYTKFKTKENLNVSILWKTKQKIKTEIHKVLQLLLRFFIFWNHYKLFSLSILWVTFLSMYTVKQLFIYWFLIWLIYFKFFKI